MAKKTTTLLIDDLNGETAERTFRAETRTLVLTGGWKDEYEGVAAALVELGAEHEVLAGHDHRVVDHPACSDRIRDFVNA